MNNRGWGRTTMIILLVLVILVLIVGIVYIRQRYAAIGG